MEQIQEGSPLDAQASGGSPTVIQAEGGDQQVPVTLEKDSSGKLVLLPKYEAEEEEVKDEEGQPFTITIRQG